MSLLKKLNDFLKKSKDILQKNVPPNANIGGVVPNNEMNQGTDEKGITPVKKEDNSLVEKGWVYGPSSEHPKPPKYVKVLPMKRKSRVGHQWKYWSREKGSAKSNKAGRHWKSAKPGDSIEKYDGIYTIPSYAANFSELRIFTSKKFDMVWEGRNPKTGKLEQHYTETNQSQGIMDEHSRVMKALPKMLEVREALMKDFWGREEARACYIMDVMGFRPGGTKAKAVGTVDLTTDNIRVDGDVVFFNFRGKKGKLTKKKVREKMLAKFFSQPKYKMKGKKIFSTDDWKINKYLDKITAPFGIKLRAKDFRTLRATAVFIDYIESHKPPKTKEEAYRLYKEALSVAADYINDTTDVARKHYILPMADSQLERRFPGYKVRQRVTFLMVKSEDRGEYKFNENVRDDRPDWDKIIRIMTDYFQNVKFDKPSHSHISRERLIQKMDSLLKSDLPIKCPKCGIGKRDEVALKQHRIMAGH